MAAFGARRRFTMSHLHCAQSPPSAANRIGDYRTSAALFEMQISRIKAVYKRLNTETPNNVTILLHEPFELPKPGPISKWIFCTSPIPMRSSQLDLLHVTYTQTNIPNGPSMVQVIEPTSQINSFKTHHCHAIICG